MNQYCPNAYDIGGLSNTRERIAKKGFAEPFSVLAFVNGQARE